MPGWTQPTTWADGSVPVAATMNAGIRDDLAWLAGDALNPKPSALARNSASISIVTSAAWQALTFDTDVWNTGAVHSTITNPSRLTVPAGAPGKWLFTGSVEFASNATGVRQLALRVNGTGWWYVQSANVVSANALQLTVAGFLALNVADYVELVVLQSSGGPLNITAQASWSPTFAGMWMAL